MLLNIDNADRTTSCYDSLLCMDLDAISPKVRQRTDRTAILRDLVRKNRDPKPINAG